MINASTQQVNTQVYSRLKPLFRELVAMLGKGCLMLFCILQLNKRSYLFEVNKHGFSPSHLLH